jgi:hypothetical protein
MIREMESAASGESDPSGDWEAYFSDDKNRTKF